MKPEIQDPETPPITAQYLLAARHAAEQQVLDWQRAMIQERQSCEKRIEAIDAELKASGYSKPRKPRTKK